MSRLKKSDVLVCFMLSVRVTVAKGDKFSRSCSSEFYRVKTEIFQLISFFFVLLWKDRRII